ncbi:MAG: NAD(P)H-hydrate dehydratase [Candidatus Micrarchaeota archaeon]
MAFSLCSPSDVRSLRARKKGSHKGENGRLLILAGSRDYHGSLILSVLAAMRFVDLVYAHSTGENLRLIARLKQATPNVIVVRKERLDEFEKKADAYLIGPGWEENKNNRKILSRAVGSGKPVVLDAGALHMVRPAQLNNHILLTPHRGEFYSLFGLEANEENVRKMAKKYGCALLCKGPADFIASPAEFKANRTHHEGMTCGGSGDVLAGLVAALAADHNGLFAAACAGAYINGLAGVRLSKRMGHYAASDLADGLAAAARAAEKGV